ncbi:MAG: AAA family ATPase [Bacilli bacterium]|nr:AAA family ATPase [Bacilli bacterium]
MIILVGASASGKTEVAKLLASKHGIVKAITTTTRKMRVGERDGVDYFFISKEEFLKRKKEDSFVETTEYNSNYYGCSKSQIADDKAVIVDPNGLKSFLALNNPTVVTFYLHASDETRAKRMKNRGDLEENIKSRLNGDKIEFAKEKIAPTDFVIATDDKTLDEITELVYKSYIDTLNKAYR